MMQVKPFIEQQLTDELAPQYLEVLDESYMHKTFTSKFVSTKDKLNGKEQKEWDS